MFHCFCNMQRNLKPNIFKKCRVDHLVITHVHMQSTYSKSETNFITSFFIKLFTNYLSKEKLSICWNYRKCHYMLFASRVVTNWIEIMFRRYFPYSKFKFKKIVYFYLVREHFKTNFFKLNWRFQENLAWKRPLVLQIKIIITYILFLNSNFYANNFVLE